MSRDQQDSHGFGICVKGGKDAGHGVYVSRIEEGSLAERAGLRPGDSILEVNGTPFTSVSHDEALKVRQPFKIDSLIFQLLFGQIPSVYCRKLPKHFQHQPLHFRSSDLTSIAIHFDVVATFSFNVIDR